MQPRRFSTAKQWHAWLARNHATAPEIWIAFAKKGSGIKSVTYAEALDEALCYGWIDTLVMRLDDDFYMQRFVPRKNEARWSRINLEKFDRLEAEGRMTDAGRAKRPKQIAPPPPRFQSGDRLPEPMARALSLHPVAKRNFEALPPSERRNYVRWVVEAKREETRERRLAELIELFESNGRKSW